MKTEKPYHVRWAIFASYRSTLEEAMELCFSKVRNNEALWGEVVSYIHHPSGDGISSTKETVVHFKCSKTLERLPE